MPLGMRQTQQLDVDLPTADLYTDLTNTSHVELPTAVLYGWLHSLMPNGILPCGQKAPQYISRGFRGFRRIGMLKHAGMRRKARLSDASQARCLRTPAWAFAKL